MLLLDKKLRWEACPFLNTGGVDGEDRWEVEGGDGKRGGRLWLVHKINGKINKKRKTIPQEQCMSLDALCRTNSLNLGRQSYRTQEPESAEMCSFCNPRSPTAG